MSECGYLKACKFMNQTMADKEALAQILRSRYCMAHHDECARLKALKELGGPENVPIDLWPNDLVSADRLILRAAP